jgi:xylose isomerase
VAGKTMKEHLRFRLGLLAFSFVGNGADPFGGPTHQFAWDVKTAMPLSAPKIRWTPPLNSSQK